jgi:hypothetical protein
MLSLVIQNIPLGINSKTSLIPLCGNSGERCHLILPQSHMFNHVFFPFSYSFCIIDGPETIEDFAQMQSQEIQDNIKSRRNKIFLSMEEVSNFLF